MGGDVRDERCMWKFEEEDSNYVKERAIIALEMLTGECSHVSDDQCVPMWRLLRDWHQVLAGLPSQAISGMMIILCFIAKLLLCSLRYEVILMTIFNEK